MSADDTAAQRPAWIEIDLAALRDNAARIRQAIGERTTLYAVVKGDAYGVGIKAVVETLKDTADVFAAGDFDEAMTVRAHARSAAVLLYGSYTPDQMGALAARDIILTVYSPECVTSLEAIARPVTVMVKVDCGFGRLGLRESDAAEALRRIRRLAHVRLRGLYTHVGAGDDPDAVAVQEQRFAQAQRCAEAIGFTEIESMMASSRVLLGYPHLRFNAVNPGRFLYGLLEAPWRERAAVRPVLSAVKSRLMQIKHLPEGRRLGYRPFSDTLPPDVLVGVAAIGFAGGLPRGMDGTPVLVRGRRATVIGLASMEHLLVDLTGIDGAAVGDEIMLFGTQGDASISASAFSEGLGLTELELVPRLGRGLRRVYLG